MAKYFTKDGDEYKEVEENLLAQAEVDNVIEKRLERERGKFADYDSLKEKAGKVDSIATEYEDKLKVAGETQATLGTQLAEAKLETEKVKIVHEFKLSDDLVEFVTGKDAAEMRERAEKLAKGIGGKKFSLNKDPKPDEKKSDTKVIAGKLFGGKSED